MFDRLIKSTESAGNLHSRALKKNPNEKIIVFKRIHPEWHAVCNLPLCSCRVESGVLGWMCVWVRQVLMG